jgi:hypothetical protein
MMRRLCVGLVHCGYLVGYAVKLNGEEYLPFLNDLADTVIRSTNLASLLQDLATAQQYLR